MWGSAGGRRGTGPAAGEASGQAGEAHILRGCQRSRELIAAFRGRQFFFFFSSDTEAAKARNLRWSGERMAHALDGGEAKNTDGGRPLA